MENETVDILDIDVTDIEPLQLIPDDSEVKLRIISAKSQEAKKTDTVFLNIRLESTQHELADDIYARLFLPTNKPEDKKKDIKKKEKLLAFYKAFGIDYSQGKVDLSRCEGKEGWAIIGVEENDQTHEEQNYVKRFVVGR